MTWVNVDALGGGGNERGGTWKVSCQVGKTMLGNARDGVLAPDVLEELDDHVRFFASGASFARRTLIGVGTLIFGSAFFEVFARGGLGSLRGFGTSTPVFSPFADAVDIPELGTDDVRSSSNKYITSMLLSPMRLSLLVTLFTSNPLDEKKELHPKAFAASVDCMGLSCSERTSVDSL
jgi:hypothetical protein